MIVANLLYFFHKLVQFKKVLFSIGKTKSWNDFSVLKKDRVIQNFRVFINGLQPNMHKRTHKGWISGVKRILEESLSEICTST